MQTHAGNGRKKHSGVLHNTGPLATVRLRRFSLPCDLDLRPVGQCMPSDCYRVYVYQVCSW